ncbi:hypothetical protein H0H87_007639 [Tephrocybe sp. NHM501043]|nr:hypothetical protein H0H87_007639 [Tephrocybe sp. NHM501043]
MPNLYNNPPWSQPQASFAQQPPQMKDFDFTAVSGNSRDLQSHGAYTYPPSQLQLPSGSGSSQAGVRNNFTAGQDHSRSGSFGNEVAPAPANSTSFAGFGPDQTQRQAVESFDPMFSGVSSQDQLGWTETNPYAYGKPIPNRNFSGSSFTNATESSYLNNNHLSSSPSAIQDTFPQSSQYSYTATPANADPRAKRARGQEEYRDDDQDADVSDAKDAAKAKSGACSRCKNLKVKCEFKTETDPCKRCLNGGHDCVIPGRKKRRTPPKREHLLNQIREQAAQIKELMAQLEKSGNSPHRRSSSATSDSLASSPLMSPTSTHSSYIAAEPASTSNTEANDAVKDWIAKAKQSFEEFDVFIGIGGAGMPKSYLVDHDLEKVDSDEDDDDYVNISDNESDYDIAIEHHDGDELPTATNGTLKHQRSSSSVGTNGTGLTHKKHSGGSEKPAILPGEAVPFGLFGDLSLKNKPKKRGSSAEIEEEDKLPGIANTNFFRSTPAPEAMDKRLASIQNPPLILARGIITPKEAEQLFKIYFDRMNLSLSLLDPVLYTPQRTLLRSPFLFTVICAIASRFYAQRPSLYTQAMQCAQQAAGMALISGHKNVEMCSAYILLSLCPAPVKRWEDQRSWLYLGLAIRTATDLNLHLPNTAKPVNENHAREMLNRTRVWLNCFNLDRSTGSQYGKPPIISSDDYMANHSENWWKSSPYNMKGFDVHICAYNAELKVMASFIQQIYNDPHHPTGLNKNVDFERIASETDDKIKQLANKWIAILEEGDLTDPQNSFRTGLIKLAYPYARLIALSYGFQHAFGKNNTDENPFLTRCLNAAFDVVNPVLDDLCRPSQKIFFRHGPEAQSVFITFASAFLVKLLQPKFASYLTTQKRLEIRQVVQKVVDLLSSPEIAIDDRHGPGLYSRFLKGLLAAPMAQVDPTSPSAPARKPRPPPPPPIASQVTETQNYYQTVYNGQSSRATSVSLSPVPRQEALSFESFAPGDATDPFAPGSSANSLALHLGGEDGPALTSDFFQPSLPFDDAILHTNFSWDTFQQSLSMDYRTQDPIIYSDQQQYMTGVQQ